MLISRILAIGTFRRRGRLRLDSHESEPRGADTSPAASNRTDAAPLRGGGTVGVTIQDFTFSPDSVTIKVGTSVQWAINGPSAHRTTSDTGVWDSGVISPPGSGMIGSASGTFTFAFMEVGTFRYHCSIHPPSIYPGFVGTVIVTQ